MTTTTIEVTVLVGDQPYGLQVVGDPDDVMLTHDVGRAVSLCLIEHASAERKNS